ncbi:MAG: ABC transporter ATP-binding protein [Spirochaetota bacterium]
MRGEKVLELVNLTKRFGDIVAVNNLSISGIYRGEFVTFLGPSGCGKTTLLRMIGGFYYPTSGEIIMHGKKINFIPPEKRKTSMVFQNYALFPHMSVVGNIAYGLKLRKLPREEINRRVKNILKIVQLEGLEDRRPTKLSGGQQQRVALARCIVIEPEIILLDEPLSNLDATLRVMMREEIRKIQQNLGLTTIFVTHDQEEAMSMSDRIVVMNRGEIEQIGTPEEIYEKPASLFVAGFIGHINLIRGEVKAVRDGHLYLTTSIGELINKNPEFGRLDEGQEFTAVIRPESVALKPPSSGYQTSSFGENCIQGKIEKYTYIGSLIRYYIEVKGYDGSFIVDVSNPTGKGIFHSGSTVSVVLPEKFHCII